MKNDSSSSDCYFKLLWSVNLRTDVSSLCLDVRHVDAWSMSTLLPCLCSGYEWTWMLCLEVVDYHFRAVDVDITLF